MNNFSVGKRAGGLAGTGPGAGGGSTGGGGPGRSGVYLHRFVLSVTPGTPYQINVGTGGSAVGASGKGADGFVLIEW